ncbi:MAG TPA: hypothetical protein VLW50_09915 [Streptosporangiaceae bacterium]|nr:hypothetical protein [Streptosporangiaceae bacterium]
MTDPYGYNPKTDTVRVDAHDLARLLLQFRRELERPGGTRPWFHMADFDRSFERLADAVDHRYKMAGLPYAPDYRMRCNRTAGYAWPAGAPYDGGPAKVVRLRQAVRPGERSHYTGRPWRTLCGLQYGDRDTVKPDRTEPDCRECLRENAIAAAGRAGQARP